MIGQSLHSLLRSILVNPFAPHAPLFDLVVRDTLLVKLVVGRALLDRLGLDRFGLITLSNTTFGFCVGRATADCTASRATHGLPTVWAPVYRGCPCRDPPV